MKKPAKQKPFATERELCARFLSAVGDAWVAYPESNSWDILLVRKSDGFQIGIQAKLKLNVHVIAQTIEDSGGWSAERHGPDCRAVLVPEEDAGGFDTIANYIGFTIIRVLSPADRAYRRDVFQPALPKPDHLDYGSGQRWHEWAPVKRHKLLEYVPDVAAGASAPLQLTKWKIAAMKIAITLERRGYVTRSDFKHHNIDHRRWLAAGFDWLRLEDGKYVRGGRTPDFKQQHPRVYGEIAADFDKWVTPGNGTARGPMFEGKS